MATKYIIFQSSVEANIGWYESLGKGRGGESIGLGGGSEKDKKISGMQDWMTAINNAKH